MAQILCMKFQVSTGGSVVEFSPATREARVRFPASATADTYHFAMFFLLLFMQRLTFSWMGHQRPRRRTPLVGNKSGVN